jgi:hypothetical protein
MPTEPTLDSVVQGAFDAPADVRIEFRDPIARFGEAGIDRVVPWLSDPRLASFAVRVVARAAEFGSADTARLALQRGLSTLREPALADAKAALVKLGSRPRSSSRTRQDIDSSSAMALDELVEGNLYKRRALHLAGLGGNQQKGISYPASGTYVMLFSDPGSEHEWGYRDGPMGSDGYRYYGEWNGTGDMLPTGGNAAIVDRSPEIYLFVKGDGGHYFRGRHSCLGVEHRPAARDGKEYSAFVFELRRVPHPGDFDTAGLTDSVEAPSSTGATISSSPSRSP